MLLSPTEYYLLVEHSPVMIWRAGLDAKCDYFNETWLEYTGKTLEQEKGDGWAAGVHADDLDRCVQHYLDNFHRRQAFEMEYRLRRHDGAYRWIFDRGVPYNDANGAFAGFIGSCVDIEDRRRTQDADREQLRLARDFEERILAIVSHDIRNPLGAITVGLDLLKLRAKDDDAMREIANRIARSTDRITDIVTSLLDVSRELHGEGIPIVAATADLSAIARDVVEEIRAFARTAIELDAPAAVTGAWDANRLSQAISNLVGNAVKHGAGGSVHVNVRGDASTATVEVHNLGAIPPHTLSSLFQPFTARDPNARHRDGLGLGLFIARSIVRAHRGDIDVTSSDADGTTFRITLPTTNEARSS